MINSHTCSVHIKLINGTRIRMVEGHSITKSDLLTLQGHHMNTLLNQSSTNNDNYNMKLFYYRKILIYHYTKSKP